MSSRVKELRNIILRSEIEISYNFTVTVAPATSYTTLVPQVAGPQVDYLEEHHPPLGKHC